MKSNTAGNEMGAIGTYGYKWAVLIKMMKIPRWSDNRTLGDILQHWKCKR